MRHTVPRFLAATVLVAGSIGLLGGCTAESADEPLPPTSTRSSTPDPAPSDPAPSDTLPASAGDGAPLGLSVRYVDENGRFVTVSPESFPR